MEKGVGGSVVTRARRTGWLRGEGEHTIGSGVAEEGGWTEERYEAKAGTGTRTRTFRKGDELDEGCL